MSGVFSHLSQFDGRPCMKAGTTQKAWTAKYKHYKRVPVPRYPQVKSYSFAAARAGDKAAHTAALAKPQAFRLTGDGEHTQRVRSVQPSGLGALRVALVEARYRDWFYSATVDQ